VATVSMKSHLLNHTADSPAAAALLVLSGTVPVAIIASAAGLVGVVIAVATISFRMRGHHHGGRRCSIEPSSHSHREMLSVSLEDQKSLQHPGPPPPAAINLVVERQQTLEMLHRRFGSSDAQDRINRVFAKSSPRGSDGFPSPRDPYPEMSADLTRAGTPQASADGAGGGEDAKRWFYVALTSEGVPEERGPVSWSALGDLRRAGELSGATRVWCEGRTGWTRFDQV